MVFVRNWWDRLQLPCMEAWSSQLKPKYVNSLLYISLYWPLAIAGKSEIHFDHTCHFAQLLKWFFNTELVKNIRIEQATFIEHVMQRRNLEKRNSQGKKHGKYQKKVIDYSLFAHFKTAPFIIPAWGIASTSQGARRTNGRIQTLIRIHSRLCQHSRSKNMARRTF